MRLAGVGGPESDCIVSHCKMASTKMVSRPQAEPRCGVQPRPLRGLDPVPGFNSQGAGVGRFGSLEGGNQGSQDVLNSMP